MSMKSFDKFCEHLILAEPGSEREVYDERQKVLQWRLGVEVLGIYAGASILSTFIFDFAVNWAESQCAVLVLIGVLCITYWQIRCAANGCLIPVKGKFSRKYTAIMIIIIAVLNLLRYIYNIGDDDFFIKDGLVSNDMLFAVSFMLLIINGIFLLCAVRRDTKKNGGEIE